MNKFATAFWSLWLSALLCSLSYATMDVPSAELKDIHLTAYIVTIKKTLGGNNCSLDMTDIKTSLKFIANQSTHLKLVEWSKAMDATLPDGGGRPIDEEFAAEFLNAPAFFFDIAPIQIGNACAATITANVSAPSTQAQLLANHRGINMPMIELWATQYSMSAPAAEFSRKAIGICEQIMKAFVNDWAESQRQFK